MCLGVPGVVTAVEKETADVDISGVVYKARIELVENVQVGDFVLVHAGYVLEKLEKEDAQETLRLIRDVTEGIVS